MTELELPLIAEKLDQMGIELRRQGRAAVAAQAAAESCLSGVEQLEAQLAALAGSQSPVTNDRTLESLFPLFDALIRVAKETAGLESESTKSWPWPLVRADRARTRLQNLRQGVRLLDAAFHQAMDHLDVSIERRVGIAVDPDIHRVVEARDPSATEAPDTVVEVRRCGYIRHGNVLREADVVATRSHKSKATSEP